MGRVAMFVFLSVLGACQRLVTPPSDDPRDGPAQDPPTVLRPDRGTATDSGRDEADAPESTGSHEGSADRSVDAAFPASPPHQLGATGAQSDAEPGAAPIEPMELTPAQVARYQKARKDPDVMTIRAFLDRLRRSPDSLPSPGPAGLDDLRKIPVPEVTGPFILLDVSGYLLGGNLYTVIFKAPSHRVVRFWSRYGEVKQIIVDDLPADAHDEGVRYYEHVLGNPALAL